MTNQFNQKVVIHYLQKKRSSLYEQLRSINKVIDSISNQNSTDQEISTPYSYDTHSEIIAELHSRKQRLLAVNYFSSTAKLDQKISFALTQLGQGFREDILEVILQQQNELDPYKLEKLVAVRLCYLLKQGFIQGHKIGRRYEYSLIAEDAESDTPETTVPTIGE